MAYSDKHFFQTKISDEEINKLTDSNDDFLFVAIESADSLINSYLKNIVKYIPLGYVPPSIQQCSYDIALFYLHDRIQYSEIPQWVEDKYNAAIDFLTKIAKGIISLDIDSSANPAEDNIKFYGKESVMDRDSF